MIPGVPANIPLTGLGKHLSAYTVVQEFWCFCRLLGMFCGKLSRRLGCILQKRKLVLGNGVQEKCSVWPQRAAFLSGGQLIGKEFLTKRTFQQRQPFTCVGAYVPSTRDTDRLLTRLDSSQQPCRLSFKPFVSDW